MTTSTRPRRPPRPSSSLEEAVQDIAQIEGLHGRHTIARGEAAGAMGLAPSGGRANSRVASLIQYGLLEKSGTGKVAVSSLAERILHPPISDDRPSAVEEALKHPDVFCELYTSFRDPTSVPESAVVTKLRSLRGSTYNENQAKSTARLFLQSIEYLIKIRANNLSIDNMEQNTEHKEKSTPSELNTVDQVVSEALEGFKLLCGTQLSPAGNEVRIYCKGTLGQTEFNVVRKLLEAAELAMVGGHDPDISSEEV